MKIQITENDIKSMSRIVVERIIRGEDWDYDDNTYTLDLNCLIATCAYRYYKDNQEAGMAFMKKYYPDGIKYIQEYGYNEMLHEACGNIDAFWNDLPDGDVEVGDYSNDISPEIKSDTDYLLQAGIEPEIVKNFKDYSLDWARYPESTKIDLEY